ncbi:MAG TPA: RNA 2',3'-cyclic phosphodiesterase [Rectinema sp.]|jgi:2'-5' RNA ligase|nr:RNA 2',3'-cyclic phosphodiesterase [Rectinema sp.]HOE75009.1 RNA 2',3'-cyclic phosphodiesterase [Rectinema sp.]HOM92137.1 RNA 2',3'-cyclic phosphodiesterase [Rectinema sp.]HOR47846.1 RNA 2',3'-cyclic phosphodiesterase [Rectinema sp.]HOU05969.1 RNA 2',3'-cyclic phosphodiesterase [Rectinema sp.]
MRLFAALPFPVATQNQIGAYCASLEEAFRPARPSWVPPQNLHLTLHFFGELEAEDAEKLKILLSDLANLCPPLRITTEDLSMLPSMNRPRVLYLATHIEPFEPLTILINRIREIAIQLGAETDARPWKAHLTLARLKLPIAPELSSLPRPPKLSLSIDSFELLRSTLSPSGAVYSRISRFALYTGTSTL